MRAEKSEPDLRGHLHRFTKHPHGFTQTLWDTGTPAAGKTDGETLVFIHGNPSSKHLWRHIVAHCAPDFRCIAIDHIGMGQSDQPTRADFLSGRYDFHFTTRGEDLARVLAERVPEGKLTLIVHDWGGIIGLRYALQNLPRIARLVITNTVTFPLLPGKKLPFAIGFVRNWWLGGLVCKYLNGFQRGAVWLGVGQRLSKAAAKGYLEAHPNAGACEAILRFVRDIPLKPDERGFAEIEQLRDHLHVLAHLPMQIHWGMRDFVFDADYLAEFERRFPQAQSFRYPNAGHWLTEDAHEDMAARMLAFLRN